jgi:hypothetical protein
MYTLRICWKISISLPTIGKILFFPLIVRFLQRVFYAINNTNKHRIYSNFVWERWIQSTLAIYICKFTAFFYTEVKVNARHSILIFCLLFLRSKFTHLVVYCKRRCLTSCCYSLLYIFIFIFRTMLKSVGIW